MSPSPYAPVGFRTVPSERQDPRASFLARMRLLGATPDEVQVVDDHWDDLGDDWTVADRERMLAWGDDELRAEILAVRVEYREGVETEEQAYAREARERLAAAIKDAEPLMTRAVPAILEWVGADPVRAEAVLELEVQAPTPRKTLMAGIDAVASTAPVF